MFKIALLLSLTLSFSVFAAEPSPSIRDLFFESAQQARASLHQVVSGCMARAKKVAPEERKQWCRSELETRLRRDESMLNEIGSMTARCTDDACRERAAANSKAQAQMMETRKAETRATLEKCDTEALSMLEQRCKQIETSFHPPE